MKVINDYRGDRKYLYNVLLTVPTPIIIFTGRNNYIEFSNRAVTSNKVRRRAAGIQGKTLLEAFPEMYNQQYPETIQDLYSTKKNKTELESLMYLEIDGVLKKFYFDLYYTTLISSADEITGVMVTLNDVTEKVENRNKAQIQEERAALAADVAGIATWELDLQTHEMVHSESLPVAFGKDRFAKISYNQMLTQFDTIDLSNIAEPAFAEAMQSGQFKYEVRIHKKLGQTTWIRSQGKIFFDERGEAVKMIGTIIDITGEKNSRDVLMESELKFRLLADSLPQKIWTSEPDGTVNYCNLSIYNYYKLSKKELESKGWLEMVHPNDVDTSNAAWKNSILSGEKLLIEHRLKASNGQYRWHLSQALPQVDISGMIQMWVGTSTDIEDQKMFTQGLELKVQERTTELINKNIELVKMNIELQSFANISSHDLQEPVRKIQMFISKIGNEEKGNLSENVQLLLDKIKGSANRMQTLIQDLIAYSRTNNPTDILVKVDLNEILNEVISDYTDLIEEKSAEIEVHGLCDAMVIPFQIRQLFNNLLGNALKFTRANVKPLITIAGSLVTGREIDSAYSAETIYCKISISDNGIGFNEKYKDKILEVFQRLHDNNVYEGTGIGLAIVNKIVENHRGILTASSAENEGANFCVYLPVE